MCEGNGMGQLKSAARKLFACMRAGSVVQLFNACISLQGTLPRLTVSLSRWYVSAEREDSRRTYRASITPAGRR